jgi:squalene-hopene/tetraprenyl-beta-curcumene cyclase
MRLAACAIATLLAFATIDSHAAPAKMDPHLRQEARHAVDAGLHFLRENEAADGSLSKSVGVTALALRAFLESSRRYNESDGAFITRPVAFILAHVNDDGSISESIANRSYNTAVALTALAATHNDAYADVMRKGQDFLRNHQVDEDEGYDVSHRYYGGIGYGGDERPDLSNEYMALEALRATALDPKDPVWEKALVFVSRSQNRSESNDQDWAGNDGGFIYMPGWNPDNKPLDSYGGMTAAGLLSLLFAGVDREDPRVKAAYEWIRTNYTLEENPGTGGKNGLFYYYNVYAKCMTAYGEVDFTDAKGQRHNWRDELATKLVSLQGPDGSWVNHDSNRWWEDNPVLVTSWVVIALNQATR